jgi:hypothetical protein
MLKLVNREQIKTLSNLLVDLGKIVVGSVVIGFFIPSLKVSFLSFLIGIAFTVFFFYFGIASLTLVKDK